MRRVSSTSRLPQNSDTVVRKLPRQERSQLTVEAILEASYQLFLAKGFQTTATQIAERAGVSVGSMYQYFPNKEAILQTLIERRLTTGFAGVVQEVLRGQQDRPSAARLIGDFVQGVMQVYRQERALLHLERDHVAHPRPAMGDGQQVREAVAALETAIQALPGVNPSRSAIVCLIVVQTVDNLCRQFIVQPTGPVSERDLHDEILAMLGGYLGGAVASDRPDLAGSTA